MGYDVLVLGSPRCDRIAHAELSQGEHFGLLEFAADRPFPLLDSLPDYWGGAAARIAVDELRALKEELQLVLASPSVPAETVSGARKLYEIATAALRSARPIEIVPD